MSALGWFRDIKLQGGAPLMNVIRSHRAYIFDYNEIDLNIVETSDSSSNSESTSMALTNKKSNKCQPSTCSRLSKRVKHGEDTRCQKHKRYAGSRRSRLRYIFSEQSYLSQNVFANGRNHGTTADPKTFCNK